MKANLLIIIALSLFINPSFAVGQSVHVDDSSDSVNWKQIPTNFIIEKQIVKRIRESELLTNISDFRLDGVSATFSGNLLTVQNLKVLSDTTDFSDYILIDFLMDIKSFQLIPVNIEITNDLGIYYPDEKLFSKDITSDISMETPTGTTLGTDTLHYISASSADEFTMFLESGTAITMRLQNFSDDCMFEIYQPDGRSYERSLYRSGSGWYMRKRPILKSGTYKFRFVPQNGDTINLQFGFTNNNRKYLTNISSGGNISVSLTGWGNEYAKYILSLNKGDLISVSKPSDSDIDLYLLDSNGQLIVHRASGGELDARVYSSGNHYLFIENTDYQNGSNYNGTVTITPDSNISNYPVLGLISQETATQGMPFSLQLSASNAPTEFAATGLPSGLSIDETNGLISGIPTISGIFPIKVSVVNEYGQDQKNFLLTVQDSLIWDIDDNKKWSLPDIIYGLQILTGLRNEK